MPPMSEQPLTRAVLASVLADFRRDLILPDMERVVQTAVGELRVEMNAHFDDVCHRFERLETRSHERVSAASRSVSRS